MILTRRTLFALAAALASPRRARADTYPARPVRILAGFAPGGINDTYARLIGQSLSDYLHEQFIVENRAGAGGTLAAEGVAKAAADGYTLLLTTSADAWNATLYDNLNFDILRDFAPVASIARGAGLLVVHPALAVQSVPELLAAARRKPGTITVASAGIGSAPFMYWELFRSMTGLDMIHVPYHGGGPAIAALLGGEVQVYFGTFASSLKPVRAGRLRALAVTSAKRVPVLPDTPALAEFLPGYDASIYVGLTSPRGTPPPVVATLNSAVGAALGDSRMTDRIAALGDTPLPLSAERFAALIADETEKWRKVIRAANIKAE
jgi:tripartite-type tricarboxylate transporter receptor subunit TctC